MIAKIIAENAKVAAGTSDRTMVNVKGAIIGNGWTDPWNQYDVSEYAFGVGLIDQEQLRGAKTREESCKAGLAQKEYST